MKINKYTVGATFSLLLAIGVFAETYAGKKCVEITLTQACPPKENGEEAGKRCLRTTVPSQSCVPGDASDVCVQITNPIYTVDVTVEVGTCEAKAGGLNCTQFVINPTLSYSTRRGCI